MSSDFNVNHRIWNYGLKHWKIRRRHQVHTITRSRLALGVCFLLASAFQVRASTIGIEEMSEYVHDSTGLIEQADSTSANFFTTLDGNNLGSFGWVFTNTSSSALSNVRVFGFLDADINAAINTYFNEYGTFVSLALPPSEPKTGIAASQWQIDEPGFVFGTIIHDLEAGHLRNQNFVPSTAPDDVSFAIGFDIGMLAPGQSVRSTFFISPTNIGGLEQTDPDSAYSFYFNGGAVVGSGAVTTPEPPSLPSFGIGLLAVYVFFKTVARKTARS